MTNRAVARLPIDITTDYGEVGYKYLGTAGILSRQQYAACSKLLIHNFYIPDIEGTPLLLHIGFDITERKLIEEKLTEAIARAELYVDLMAYDISNMNHVALGYRTRSSGKYSPDPTRVKNLAATVLGFIWSGH